MTDVVDAQIAAFRDRDLERFLDVTADVVITGFTLPGFPAELHALVVCKVTGQKIRSVMLLS